MTTQAALTDSSWSDLGPGPLYVSLLSVPPALLTVATSPPGSLSAAAHPLTGGAIQIGAVGQRVYARAVEGSTTVVISPAAAPGAGADAPASVVGQGDVAVASFTTPAGTTAYSVGDLIANSATAGSVAPLQLAVARVADATALLRGMRLKTTDTGAAGAVIRVHLYKLAPTASLGDNGSYLTSESDYIGSVDITLNRSFTDAVKGVAGPTEGADFFVEPAAGTALVYALLEARSPFTPQGGKLWTLAVPSLRD